MTARLPQVVIFVVPVATDRAACPLLLAKTRSYVDPLPYRTRPFAVLAYPYAVPFVPGTPGKPIPAVQLNAPLALRLPVTATAVPSNPIEAEPPVIVMPVVPFWAMEPIALPLYAKVAYGLPEPEPDSLLIVSVPVTANPVLVICAYEVIPFTSLNEIPPDAPVICSWPLFNPKFGYEPNVEPPIK